MKVMICFLVLMTAVSCGGDEKPKCNYKYIYHLGDSVTDIGNSIHILPNSDDIPANHLPYGMNYPSGPTGRWSDGNVSFDYTATAMGMPKIVPYLTLEKSTIYDGVVFSVAGSPVLSHEFYKSRGIQIPPYAVSLDDQIAWFTDYSKSVCSTSSDCADWIARSPIMLGDIEGNDIGYSLTQGKSIQEVETYMPIVTSTQINASRELIKLGATMIAIPGNHPVGCYPYILTALQTDDPTAYDEIGCLKSVNDLVISRNKDLQRAIEDLQREFPQLDIDYSNTYDQLLAVIRESSSLIGNISPDGNKALKACCGIGGKYNFDSKRFCGSQGVPVCSNADEYIFWDGLHLTQNAYFRWVYPILVKYIEALDCTVDDKVSSVGSSSSRFMSS